MTPERRKKIEDIFHAALELEPSKRGAFLDQACGDDEAVRQEVELLLANTSESFLEQPLADEGMRRIAESHDDSLVGQTIDHYLVLEWLGAGGMGEVYLAEDLRLGRKVALKLLPESFTRNADQVRRFHREARAASALNHPNIITIHELGQADSLHFIVMEFIEGVTLRQQMRGQMPVREVLNTAIQVASGLSAAHNAGIIHRDIKPENIMLGGDGYLKVLDFGIAKFKEEALLSSPQPEIALAGNMQASAVAGTLSYMSPEQARGEPIDARTDLFSLGTLLYEMVAGRRPFEGETQEQTLNAILNDEAQPLTTSRPEVPHDLERIISKALMKNPDERYPSARELLADLREFNEETDKAMDAKERANRMLRQYLSIYAVDKRELIPITKLWFVRRYSDLERGERGRELLKKSLRRGLLKSGGLVLSLALVVLAGSAALSMTEEWEGFKLSDGHTRAARQAAFSPDGKRLVTVGEDNKVIVWDFEKRQRIATFDDHRNIVPTVAYSPDGKWFVTGSADKTVIVWDAERLERAAVLNEHEGMVTAVAFSTDGKLLASTSDKPDERTVLWNVRSWNKVRELPLGINYGDLLFSPDGRYLLSNAKDRHKWDVITGQQASSDLMLGGNWIALSPQATLLSGIGSSGEVDFSDLVHRKITTHRNAHRDHGRAAAFSPDGRLLATAADDIILWDATTLTILARLTYPSIVWHVAFSPEGRWLVSTHGDGAVLLWDVADRRLVANFNEHSQAVRGVAFSPDGKKIASASEDNSVIIWDAARGTKNAVLLGHLGLQKVAFSRDGTWAASCEMDHAVFLWDLEKGERRLVIENTVGGNYDVAISPDGRWVASTWGVYDSADGHQVVQFERQMYGVAFSHDGRRLACATPSRFLYLFDIGAWQLREQLEVADAALISASFSPDSKHLVTGDDEGSVRLWEIEPLRQVAVLGRHTSRIKCVAFSPDGREVASAGDDQTIRLWDVGRRRLISTIGTHTSPVLSVAFSPDGKRLVSGEHDHSVRLWTRHRVLWAYRLS